MTKPKWLKNFKKWKCFLWKDGAVLLDPSFQILIEIPFWESPVETDVPLEVPFSVLEAVFEGGVKLDENEFEKNFSVKAFLEEKAEMEPTEAKISFLQFPEHFHTVSKVFKDAKFEPIADRGNGLLTRAKTDEATIYAIFTVKEWD